MNDDRIPSQASEDSALDRLTLRHLEPDEAIYYGLAGEIVRTVAPHTEAAPVAILLQLLMIFGTTIGRKPHFSFGTEKHYLNMFGLLVGRTGAGRKGTSYNQATHIYRLAFDPDPLEFTSGLSTGEGLITAIDATPPDSLGTRRLFVYESEFAAICKVKRREGNKISEMLRSLWDQGSARVMTKVNPLAVEKAHLSVVAHITHQELHGAIQATDITNGFLNRFLIISVHRSGFLADSTTPDKSVMERLADQLLMAILHARKIEEMQRSDAVRECWRLVYPSLSIVRGAVAEALMARAAAHVMRLACIYALLDKSPTIELVHLKAALALWQYVEASIIHIFGSSLGNASADKLLAHLRAIYPEGMSSTDIQVFFSRHGSPQEVLMLLLEYGVIEQRLVPNTGGRPKTMWYAKHANEAIKGTVLEGDSSLNSHNSPGDNVYPDDQNQSDV